jgi:parallel beta-helix repeat protein
MSSIDFLQTGSGAVARPLDVKISEIAVSVTDFGAAGDGTTDDTDAFQAAHDSLPNGGIIHVPTSEDPYVVQKIDISNPNITIFLEPGATLKRSAAVNPTGSTRAIFYVTNFLQAHFVIDGGGTIDLNGQGPMLIGQSGMIPNLYGYQTIAGIVSITGRPGAAVFALRSSHITVRNVRIKNSTETGILIRNSSDTLVSNCQFENIANYGVEWSLVPAAGDGGSGPMPDCSRNFVRECTFTDVDDYGLGSGNGCAVGGGGDAPVDYVSDHEVTDCTFIRCLRDVNLEFAEALQWWQGVKLRGGRSYQARQSSVGLINTKDYTVQDWIGENTGSAPPSVLIDAILDPPENDPNHWPSIVGLTVSGEQSGAGKVAQVQFLDKADSKCYYATDGEIDANSAIFDAAGASFTSDDEGLFIGIVGAGPQSSNPIPQPGFVTHVARIVTVNSATQVVLDRAAVTTVSGAKYAYGQALREGMRLYFCGDVDVTDCRVIAGISSGLTDEPDAAGISVESPYGTVRIRETEVIAPATAGTTPVGIRLVDLDQNSGRFETSGNSVTGFNATYVGLYDFRGSTNRPISTLQVDSALAAGAANTYGTEIFLTPDTNFFKSLLWASIDVSSIGSETITAAVTAYFFDSAVGTTLELNTGSNTSWQLTAKQLASLNPSSAHLRALGFKRKSTIGGSTAVVLANAVGLQS